MKKLIWASTAALVMLLTAGASPVAAAAGDTADSTATIKFHENTGPTTPIDPGDTDKETGMNGPLSLDLVPNLDFGDHAAKAMTKFDDAGPHKIQVTDSRSANTGWTVTLSAAVFTDGAGNDLTGATLSSDVAANKSGAVDGALDASIDTAGITSLAVSDLATDGTGVANIFTGAANTSSGTWQAIYDANQFHLTVPTGVQKAGTFTSQLTWTINDGPVQ